LGLGLREAKWKEIEIKNNELGQPVIDISGKLKNIVSVKGVSKYFISITHTKEYAVAQVILEGTLDK
jgi:holo-[acyl-carrier protein] synthase